MSIKQRLRNKAFIAACVSFGVLVIKTCTNIKLPDGIDVVVNTGLSLLVGVGVLIDPTTPGVTDK